MEWMVVDVHVCTFPYSACLLASVFLRPFTILENHITFIVNSMVGATDIRTQAKVSICLTCQRKVSTDKYMSGLIYILNSLEPPNT